MNPKLTLAALTIAVSQASFAAETIEEIVVTATKRASTIQDVPFSINAQSQRDIQRSGVSSIEELSRNVAGLTVQNLGPGQSQVAIRGVSAGQVIRDQPGVKEQVGVYMDESVISLSLFTPDFDLYDLNRVETLRGPQGTLFGSGSVGGTIRYITNQPAIGESEGSMEFDVNTVTDGNEGGSVKGMVNVPLTDNAALRLVGYSTEYAGYIDALYENGETKSDVNSGNRSGIRAALRWEPTENVTITPRVVFQQIDTEGFNRQEVFNVYANPFTTTRPAVSFDEREQYLRQSEGFEDDTRLMDLTVEINFDSFDLTSVSSFLDRDILVCRDASALSGSVSIDLGYTAADVLLPSNLLDTTKLSQFTQELRLSSNSDSKLQWVVGAFYSDTDREYAQRLPTPGYDIATDAALGGGTSDAVRNGFPELDSPFNSTLPYDIEQTAIFGELTYEVSEKLSVTLGGRWYDFEEERTVTTGGLFANGDSGIVDTTESDGFNPRLLAAYKVSDTLTWNAQAAQGFRLGGVNDPLNSGLCSAGDLVTFGGFQSYDDETVWNYETGFKAGWDNGIKLNVAVFHAEIEDLQVTLDAGSCSSRISFNVEEAHSTGLEFELTAEPTDGLILSLAGSTLESEFDETVLAETGGILGGIEDGNRLASVPELQLAVSATYEWSTELFGGSDAYFSATVQHVGDRFTQPGDQVAGAGVFSSGLPFGGATGAEQTVLDLEMDAYTLINLRLGITKEDWETALYVTNLTDENADLSFDRERGGRARLSFRTNQPRTVGIVFRKFFN
ncbi:MAG: iron complex outermembrane receptor protein [Candidatus Azotimanducaceae bacterium]|jgi:iron complex outermembrane receptor protein